MKKLLRGTGLNRDFRLSRGKTAFLLCKARAAVHDLSLTQASVGTLRLLKDDIHKLFARLKSMALKPENYV